ncbi:MAG TPA: ABC transporter permease [Trueperaceae bacterium]
MLPYILRRLLFLPVVFLGVTLLIVLLMQFLSPVERAISFVQSEAQLRNIDRIIAQYGLDEPFYVQYWNWLREAAHGNLGYSRVTNQPVLTTIRERWPNTVELAVVALIPIIGLGIWLGTAAALHRDKFIDQFTRVISIFGWSLPTFVLGIWLLMVFYGGLGLFGIGQVTTAHTLEIVRPSFHHYTGFLSIDALLNGRPDIFLDVAKHLILPVVTLAVVSSAQIMRVMRSSLLDALSQDYVRTARSKGLPDNIVNTKHARRNALIPVLTLAGFSLVGLLNGTIVTETIFAYPGIGRWLADAAVQLDYAAVMGGAVFVSALVVIGNLIVDVLYGVIDPRIRYS